MNIDRAAFIASFYEKHRINNLDAVRIFLQQQDLTLHDVQLMSEKVNEKINQIQDDQDEEHYLNEIEEHGEDAMKTIRHQEFLVNQNIINNIKELTNGDVIDSVEVVRNTMKSIAVTAYKFELKYSLLILDIMVEDDEIWDKVVFH